MASAELTTPDALAAVSEQFGLAEDQAQLLAAKEGLVCAIEEEEPRRLVLKGGTLLHHVYGSPRVSIADVDYADPTHEKLDENELKSIVGADRMQTRGFRIEAERGTWASDSKLVTGTDLPFAIAPGRASGAAQLSISVSVRQAEVLGGIQAVEFHARAASGIETERISGLSLEEAAVEKVIGYCLKGKTKHFADLAWMAREYQDLADSEAAIQGMLVDKVEKEMKEPETEHMYAQAQVTDVKGLLKFLDREQRMRRLRTKWATELGTDELLLDLRETEREDGLANPEWVIQQVKEFWAQGLLGKLRR